MANAALRAQEDRTIEVDRRDLIKTLKKNKDTHVANYEAAVAGYKTVLTERLEQAYEKGKSQIDKQYARRKREIGELTQDDISDQSTYFTLLSEVNVQLEVPVSYADDYDAAIAMASWDVRDTLELAHAEFTCFVRDKWDWSSKFKEVSMTYMAGGRR